MRRIDRRIVIISALIFIIALAYGIMKFLIAQKQEPFRRPPPEVRRYVRTEQVSYSTIVSPVSAPGRLSSVAGIDLVAEASGKILTGEVPLKKGAGFHKGDVLFVIYPDEVALALKARKSQFLNLLANILPDLAVDFPGHEPVFRDFFNSINLEQRLPEFPGSRDDKLRVFLATRNIPGEYYSIQKDELQLGRHTVRAPFRGTYPDVYLEAGSYTNTGGRVAFAIQTSELEAEVPLERFDAAWVKIGDRVTLTSDRRAVSRTGKVVRKSRFVDPETQSQSIFVRIITGEKLQLLAGEYIHAEFPGFPIEGVMEMPRNAVFNTNEVFIVVNDRLQKRIINIVKYNERTLLFNGLNEGDVLVVQQLINVQEGTLVTTSAEQSEKPGTSGGKPESPPGKSRKKK